MMRKIAFIANSHLEIAPGFLREAIRLYVGLIEKESPRQKDFHGKDDETADFEFPWIWFTETLMLFVGPSCCFTLSTSPSTQSSEILSPSVRKKAAPAHLISLPVGGVSKKRPRCVPLNVIRAAARSAVANEVVYDAGIVRQRLVDRAQVIDEAIGTAPLRSKRRAKAEIAMQNLSGDSFVGLVPDLMVEALDEKPGRHCHESS